VLAAVERIDIVILVDANRRDIGIELVAGRQFRPVVGDLIPKAARTEYDRHGDPPWFDVAGPLAAIIRARLCAATAAACGWSRAARCLPLAQHRACRSTVDYSVRAS